MIGRTRVKYKEAELYSSRLGWRKDGGPIMSFFKRLKESILQKTEAVTNNSRMD